MKNYIKYGLFSFLLLFTVVNTTIGRDEGSPVPGSAAVHSPATGNENAINPKDLLPDLSLSNTQLQQTVNSLVYKRVQGDKELLLLHANKVSNIIKATSGGQARSADSLTHIFLFLFPYHFFW